MSAMFVTYVWHYIAARAIYDALLRPLLRGNIAPLLVMTLVGVLAFAVGRWSGRRARS